MYNILHALDHLYINLYQVCTNADMDKYLSFTKQFSQNNVRGKTDPVKERTFWWSTNKRTTANPATRLRLLPCYQSPTISVIMLLDDWANWAISIWSVGSKYTPIKLKTTENECMNSCAHMWSAVFPPQKEGRWIWKPTITTAWKPEEIFIVL